MTWGHVWVTDLLGDLVACAIDAHTVTVEETVDNRQNLASVTFTVPRTSPVWDHLYPDVQVIVEGQHYLVTRIEDERADVTQRTVTAEGCYLELAKRIVRTDPPYSFIGTPLGGLEDLESLGSFPAAWSVGTAPTTGTFSINENNRSYLFVLQAWAKITGLQLVFDLAERTISLVETRGTDRGPVVRYGHNLTAVRRTIEHPEATRYWIFGRGWFSIDPDELVGFVEGLDYYTSKGLSDTQARSLRWDLFEQDDRFLRREDLQAYADGRIAILAQPIVSYECDVAPLGLDHLRAGDRAGVQDPDLDLAESLDVVRRVRVLDAPWDDTVELAHLRPTLEPPDIPEIQGFELLWDWNGVLGGSGKSWHPKRKCELYQADGHLETPGTGTEFTISVDGTPIGTLEFDSGETRPNALFEPSSQVFVGPGNEVRVEDTTSGGAADAWVELRFRWAAP